MFNYDILACVNFLPTAQGGRKMLPPIKDEEHTYRPVFRIEHEEMGYGCGVVIGDYIQNYTFGADLQDVKIIFLHFPLVQGRISVGTQFTLAEGNWIVATGTITKIREAKLTLRYDFDLIEAFFADYEVRVERYGDAELSIGLSDGARLSFFNAEDEKDCLMTFGTSWHCHGDLQFSDENGFYEDFDYRAFLEEIARGNILLCSVYKNGMLVERHPDHIRYFDKRDFSLMDADEELRVRRIIIKAKKEQAQ